MSETDPREPDPREPDQPSEAQPAQPTDPAQQALSDALRVSFFLLKVVMLVLLVAYLASGVFIIDENQRGLRLRFGQIVGDPEPRVYESGWHFGMPYPIGQNITVPTGSQALSLTSAFWYAGEQSNNPNQSLNPVEDGYLLAAGGGLVHARFHIDYQISDPVAFVRHVKGLAGASPGEPASAEQLVRSVAEQGIVHAVARTSADAVIGGNANTAAAQVKMQQLLDAMNSGVTIQSVSMSDQSMPGSVQQAYQAVTTAESEKAQQIEAARQHRAEILSSAAGAAALAVSGSDADVGPLLRLLQDYQSAVRRNNQAQARQLQQRWARAFATLQMTVPTEAGTRQVRIGGEAAGVINEAKTYTYQAVQSIRTERETFLALLEQYQKNPRIVINRLWQDTRQTILTGEGVETMYAMQGRPYIVTNRDPEVARQRQQQQMQQEDQQQQNQGG